VLPVNDVEGVGTAKKGANMTPTPSIIAIAAYARLLFIDYLAPIITVDVWSFKSTF
jgi:hypothetical protein